MNKLKIPENHSGISKTLRLPENIVDDIQKLANLKNLSFNRVVISLLEFSLDNLDEKDETNNNSSVNDLDENATEIDEENSSSEQPNSATSTNQIF